MINSPARRTFTFINNEKLCEIIESAQRHVIYAAPSVSNSVAKALCSVAKHRDGVAIRIIVDANSDALRLGFGDPGGLPLLTDCRLDVRRADGLRIAVLIADENAWVYSPTPEIIFQQPTHNINNAVQVSVEFAEQIVFAIAPDITLIQDADPLGATYLAPDLPEIGSDSVTSQDLERMDQELKENPPQKFDATRKVRVYQGYFQFVKLSLTGCRLSAHTISIPKTLLNIAEDSDLQNRVRSTCRLVDDTSEFAKRVKVLEDKVRKLREDYLRSLGERYGSVILRKQRDEFDRQVAEVRRELGILSKNVEEGLQKEIEGSREKLINMLLPGVLKAPPKKLTSELFEDLSEDVAKEFIGEELDKAFPKVKELVGEMVLNCDYKDVTFEMLNDETFVKLIEAKYKRIKFSKLYSEQQTIAER